MPVVTGIFGSTPCTSRSDSTPAPRPGSSESSESGGGPAGGAGSAGGGAGGAAAKSRVTAICGGSSARRRSSAASCCSTRFTSRSRLVKWPGILVHREDHVLEADHAVSEHGKTRLVERRVMVEHAPQPFVQRFREPDAVADVGRARCAAQRVAGAIEILGHGVRADREPGVAQVGADHLEVALHFLLVDLLQRGVAALGVFGGPAEPGLVDAAARVPAVRPAAVRAARQCAAFRSPTRVSGRTSVGLGRGRRATHAPAAGAGCPAVVRLDARDQFGYAPDLVRRALQFANQRRQDGNRLRQRPEHAARALERAVDDAVQQVLDRPGEVADAARADDATRALQRVESATHAGQ